MSISEPIPAPQPSPLPTATDLLRRLLVTRAGVDEAKLVTEDDVMREAQALMAQPRGRRLMVVSGGVLDELVDGRLLDEVWVVDCDNGEAGDRYELPSYMRDLCERFWLEIPEFLTFKEDTDGQERIDAQRPAQRG